MDIASLSVVQFWAFLQVLTRFSALVAIAPVFGARQIPSQVKVWLALIFSAAITPAVAASMAAHGESRVPDSLYVLIATLVLQAAAGLLMGFVVSLILGAFQVAGSLLDLQVGFSMAQTFDPELADMAAPLGQFQYFYALLLFILANGHHILVLAVARSFTMLPAAALDLTSGKDLTMLADFTFGAIVNGLKIAAPTCAVMFALDVSFAFLSRAMPQLNIFYVGMPAKVLAGLFVLGILLPATAIFAGQLVSGEPQMLSDLLHAVHRG